MGDAGLRRGARDPRWASTSHVHLKDVLAEDETRETCRFGEGIVDVRECVQALEEIGYEGAISIEHEPETFDPSDDLRAMRAQLDEWLA